MKKIVYGCLFLLGCVLFVGILSAFQAAEDIEANNGSSQPFESAQIVDFAMKAKPAAAGSVTSIGTINKGHNIKKVTWNETYERYDVQLKGPASDYHYYDFITVATAQTKQPYVVTCFSTIDGYLTVYIFDVRTGNKVKSPFSFAVYFAK